MKKLFRVNTMSPTYKGNIVKLGSVIKGHRVIGFTHDKHNPRPEKVSLNRAIYAIGELLNVEE